jgi:two-component system, response regulator FlrC
LNRIHDLYPDIPVLMMTAHGTISSAVTAMREGAVDYLVKPFEPEVLINIVSQYLPAQESLSNEPIAEDPQSKQLMTLTKRVAASDASVLINGESGTGKEIVARAVHRYSSRCAAPFVAINCAAIPENMLEAHLFGYEKGAFTGAHKACPGKFEQAQGGTLFLDEISEMDMGLQAKLLRVLQEKEVERLGGTQMIKLDVRILSASNADIKQSISDGRFREDLYYRLNVFPISILPLRARAGDILPLARSFLHRYAIAQNQQVPILTPAAEEHLLAYDWPGNVREMENLMQRALILQTGDRIDSQDIFFEMGQEPRPMHRPLDPIQTQSNDSDELYARIKSREFDLIVEAIDACEGSRKLAAEKLGISARTLRYKMAKMREAGLDVPN